MTKEQYAEYEAAYTRGTKGFAIVAHACEENGCDEFSWARCGLCGATFGGPRHDVILTNPGPDQSGRHERKGCSDCLYYSEYGQLDDMTMMDLKDV